MNPERLHSRGAIDGFVERLPPLVIVVGKGGVGKTTCAIGVAARLASTGERTLLVSTDPAGALGPALGMNLVGGEAHAVNGIPTLAAMQLDAAAARSAFLDRWRDVLVTILDRGTYLDLDDIGGLVDAAFPGADEIFGLLMLAELLTPSASGGPQWARFVIDTAPTGHTLRLLALPDTFAAMISLLDAMQAKHRFMVSALTRRYRRDAADDFLDVMRGRLAGLRSALGDRSRAGAVLVTRTESVIIAETRRYAEALRALGISIVAVIVDALAQRSSDARAILDELGQVSTGAPVFILPRLDPPPRDLRSARLALGKLASLDTMSSARNSARDAGKRLRANRGPALHSKAGGARIANEVEAARSPACRLLHTLTIVGGKGGVGKTTVACALAISGALDQEQRGEMLLVSTDPAPSIADALGIRAPRWAHDSPEIVDAVPSLKAWQIDATTAFQQLRDRYQSRIDSLFDSLIGRNVDAVYDRTILRDLLTLAPPGIDELYALALLGEALEGGRYSRLIIDPAPTGHLLRLLELPSLAIDWSHRLMRLIMKYKDIAGLADAAEDLVKFSRRTRALDRLLHDPTRAGVVLVALDEPIVIAETARLASVLAASGISVLGQVWNRIHTDLPGELDRQLAAATSHSGGSKPIFVAPDHNGSLVGIAAIRDWCVHWRQRN